MSKRANGEGNIRKRKDGRWLITFPTGIYKDNGKREYIYRYTSTQAEASEILRRLQTEKGMGVSHGKSKIKTGDWVHEWIENHKSSDLAPATMTSYRNNFRLHINPAVGDISLARLETCHIQRMLKNIGGKRSTFVKNYNIINAALEKAVDLGMIVKNPCKGVAFPAQDEEEMRVLTQTEQRRFIKELDGEYYRPLFLTYLYSGMRMGEAVPLRWSDIDLENRTIRVNKKAIVAHDYSTHSARQEIQNFCKTKSSKRIIKITVGLTEILRQYKQSLRERAEKMGEPWSDEELAFKNSCGNIVQTRNLQVVLQRIFKKANIEGATMHTLRHTYATRCYEAGVEVKAISEQLGHASVKVTYAVYIHLLEDKKEQEIDKLGEIDKFMNTETAAAVEQIMPCRDLNGTLSSL